MKRINKKKGFTLIELVIVLAVLAIIALIAIPNFTKVRTDSLEKADIQSAEQIKDIVLMGIANKEVSPNPAKYKVTFKDNKSFDTFTILESKSEPKVEVDISKLNDFVVMMKDIKKPQVNGKSEFLVEVYGTGDNVGSVRVGYPKNENTFEKVLAGETEK